MPVKKEVCRNFAGGSCHFGQRCRFLHAAPQQQQRPQSYNNASASQSAHQKPNPYGFGNQNSSQRTTQSKPFENTWNRFSPVAAGQPSSNSRSSENYTQPTTHKCTDPDSCRRIIVDDVECDRPLWKLSCYAHWKNYPCDIFGDISYEELRMTAYDDSKRGLSIQSIVEKERVLLNSKVKEFEDLCKPGSVILSSRLSDQSTLPGTGQNTFLQPTQTNAPTSVSSFSQLGTSLNKGVGQGPAATSNNAFVQPNASGSFGQNSNPFGTKNQSSPNAFAQPNAYASFGQNSNPFGTKNLSSESTGQTVGSLFGSGPSVFGSSGFTNPASNSGLTSTFSIQTQTPTTSNSPSFGFGMDLNSSQHEAPIGKAPQPGGAGENSVWSKNSWNLGEVPEEAPPDAVCY